MLAEVALPLPLENLFSYRVPEKFMTAIVRGQQVAVPFHKKILRGVVVSICSDKRNADAAPAFKANLKELISILPTAPLPPQLLELTRWLSERYACSWGEALSLVSASWGSAKMASYRDEKGTNISVQLQDLTLRESSETYTPNTLPNQLTAEQKEAIEKIKESISSNEQKSFLLFGVTASGKTEVYLQAIEEIFLLQPSAQILFLVPEISLCSLFYKILSSRFELPVKVWHSLVSRKEKKEIAESLVIENPMILLGARSALFAPFRNLRAVILDEEHSSSYKQQEKPRYHAREVALKLAQLHRAIAILGSATPSLESFYRAQKKEFLLLKLSRSIPLQSEPMVLLLDRRKSLRKKELFCPELVEALQVCLTRREQAILVLNRRGYSTFFLCADCGTVFRCPHCELALVHFQEETAQGTKDWIRCHYCYYRKSLPQQCEQCKSTFLIEGGAGTQKVVSELKKLFPFARILRLDSDISSKKTVTIQTVQSFQKERADILVGTQMVSQGFDFPRVTVVGIVDSDTALYQPDFRAAEKTFQLVCQSAGRSARSALGGKVFVQSSLPSHYALLAACSLDYESFYKKEVEFRKSFFFPPYSKLVLFRLESAKKKEKVPEETRRLAETLKKELQGDRVQILGASPSPREQLRKRRRWQVLVKCEQEEKLLEAIRIGKSFPVSPGIRLVVDADPIQIT